MLFITMLLGEFSSGDHEKIMTICTKDIHSRNVSATLQAQKVRIWISYILHSQFVLSSVIHSCFALLSEACTEDDLQSIFSSCGDFL